MSLAIVYLARGIGGGFSSAQAFVERFNQFPPNYEYDLIFAAKGWKDNNEWDQLKKLAHENGASILSLPDSGYDWGAYIRVSEFLSHDWFCFLNTHSRPKVAGWLQIMSSHAQSKNTGAVGASGSWGTTLPDSPIPKLAWNWRLFHFPVRLARDSYLYFSNVTEFPSFPNPHLRSNAFLVRKNLFCEYARYHSLPRNKREAHKLEHGKGSFTNFLHTKNLNTLVVGKDGVAYRPEEWAKSETFRFPGQKNLLIEDNQTLLYDRAAGKYKRILEDAAWGQCFTQI